MSYTSALESVAVLAREWKTVDERVRGMAVGSDHDPNWNAADHAELSRLEKQRGELLRSIRDELIALEREHPKAFEAFLTLGVERLSALTRSTEKTYTRGEYERDRWRDFRSLPAGDRAEVFARGIALLHEHRAEIERWL